MNTPDFTKMVPGFDFLQNLMKGAGGGLPGMSQWIAPTLDPDEVDKRIQELRTVQFWLEQNARMLGATIQALEVQRMTLATLKTMNLPLSELGESLKLDPQAYAMRPTAPEPAPAPVPPPAVDPSPAPAAPPAREASTAAGATVDPMQWWGALTRQFTELAAHAIKDSPVQAATQMAGEAFRHAVQPMSDAVSAVTQDGPGKASRAPKAPGTRQAPPRKATAKGAGKAKRTAAAKSTAGAATRGR
jgi:hypothetical protein